MAFADLEDLQDRLDFELDEAQTRMAMAALEDASELARSYAGVNWQDHLAPRIVQVTVLNVAARYMRNPDGLTTSRAGDETLSWADLKGKASLHFTADEMALLGKFGRRNTIGSIGTYAWRSGNSVPNGFVPTDPPGDLFPFFAEGDNH